METFHKQIGALPYRRSSSGQTEILLVTSRGSGQWIVPKGWPMDGRSNPQAAAREAYEEAGVVGKIASKPIGCFTYEKALKGTTQPARFNVDVYPLQVDRQLTCWPEVHQRQIAWINAGQTEMIANPQLRHIIDQWLWSMESRPNKRATASGPPRSQGLTR